jgi:hypothetical protein
VRAGYFQILAVFRDASASYIDAFVLEHLSNSCRRSADSWDLLIDVFADFALDDQQ